MHTLQTQNHVELSPLFEHASFSPLRPLDDPSGHFCTPLLILHRCITPAGCPAAAFARLPRSEKVLCGA